MLMDKFVNMHFNRTVERGIETSKAIIAISTGDNIVIIFFLFVTRKRSRDRVSKS